MFETENCNIIDEKERDILYHVDYTRKCDSCNYEDTKERHFKNVLKNGLTMDEDAWICPNCGKLCITKITYANT